MIGTDHIVVDPRFLYVLLESAAYEKIIDSPADVARAAVSLLIPVGIVAALFFKHTERVNVACFDEFGYPFTLHRHKSAVVDVFFGASQVDFRVRRVHIAGDDDGLLFAIGFDEREETLVEFHFKFQALRTGASIREIDVEEIELVELEEDNAAFTVEEGIAKIGFGKDRGNFCIDSGPAIAFFDGAAPIRFIPVRVNELGRELTDFRLCFLEADDVVLGFVEPIEEAFALGSAYSVYVPGDQREAFGHGNRIAC